MQRQTLSRLVAARGAVAETTAVALGDLGLGNGDDVGGDLVELDSWMLDMAAQKDGLFCVRGNNLRRGA